MTLKEDISKIIDCQKWVFSKTYANSNPHQYIVRNNCSSFEHFDILCEYIKNNGHKEYFFGHCGTYLSFGDFTYWVMGDVINRRWNDMYKVNNTTKEITKVSNWKEMLKDGRVLHK